MGFMGFMGFMGELLKWFEENRDWKEGAYIVPKKQEAVAQVL